MSITLDEVLTAHEQSVLDHLDRQVTVPVVDFGRQGDVIVIPARMVAATPATTALPKVGFPVVRGENGGNTHLLVGEGDIRFDQDTASAESLTLGRLTVGAGAVAYLVHPEHGAIGFTPGDYTIRRQREQAEELRLVQD